MFLAQAISPHKLGVVQNVPIVRSRRKFPRQPTTLQPSAYLPVSAWAPAIAHAVASASSLRFGGALNFKRFAEWQLTTLVAAGEPKSEVVHWSRATPNLAQH